MNARERFVNTFIGGEVDRHVRFGSGAWPETLKRWEKEAALGDDIDNAFIDKYFDMDRIEYIHLISGFTSPYCPVFEKQFLEEDETTFTIIDRDGIKKKQNKKDIYLSMPQFLEFPVNNRSDYENIKVRLRPDTAGRIGMPLKDLRKKYIDRDYSLGMYICGGFGHLRELMGLEGYLMALYDEPDLIHDIMKDWLDLYIGMTRDIINAVNLDFVYIWEDMCYKNGPLLSPEKYEEFIYPYLKELVGSIRENGVRVIMLDTDGNMTKLIPWYIKCGVNVLFPFEVQAGMDIRAVREQYPDLGIIGGINKNVLAQGREEIKEEVMSKAPVLYKSGKYIATLDHSVPPNVSFDNYKFYIELLRSIEQITGF